MESAAAWTGAKRLVWEWDPIGVAGLAPDDEYDCLIGPLLDRLAAGAGEREICDFLRQELEDHFGLDAGPRDVDAAAHRLVTWWAAANGPAGERS